MAEAYVAHKTITLQMLEYGVAMHVANEFMNGLHASLSPATDFLGRMMGVRLYKQVMADKVLEDDENVFFEKTVDAPLPQSLWRRLLRRPVRTVPVDVSGYVKVKAEYFNAFPECDASFYPQSFGSRVKKINVSQDCP